MTLEQLMQSYRMAAIGPEIALSLSALVVLLAGAFLPDNAQRRVLPTLALLGTLLTAVFVAGLWNRNLFFGLSDSAIFTADNLSLFFKGIFLLSLAVVILISPRFLEARSGDRHTVIGEYYALLMFSTVGMLMVASANDLLVVFLGIETLSIALYVLAGFARARLKSNEAALKYFLLGAFATGFLLYGIALTYYATGSTLLPQIKANVLHGMAQGPTDAGIRSMPVLFAGMALLLIGLGFKAALVPFHQWTPDVYEGSPTPVAAFMAVGAKAAAFAAILRVFADALAAPSILPQWFNIALIITVLTMSLGNIVAISQESLKRMLAYSSIAHAGYLMMGVLAAANATRNAVNGNGSQTQSAVAGVLIYLLVYALMNLGAFAVLVWLENRTLADGSANADSEDANLTLSDLRGLAARSPWMAGALTIFLFSLAGVPPLAGFWGKLYIFAEAFRQGLVGLVIVGVINTVISAYYYLRPVIEMWLPSKEVATLAHESTLDATSTTSLTATLPATSEAAWRRTPAVGLSVAVCVVAVVAMLLLQSPAMEWAREASTSRDALAVTRF
jgi:NADH-quinone oxidoreductase subunit N